jgi:hypothetical protein
MVAAMTDAQVRGTLRAAVEAGLLAGWYQHSPFQGVEWVISPVDHPTSRYDRAGIRAYCALLHTT